MEQHKKEKVTKNNLRKILLKQNTGALLSVIISLRLSNNKMLKNSLINEIFQHIEKNKKAVELAIKSNLNLNFEIVDENLSQETETEATEAEKT